MMIQPAIQINIVADEESIKMIVSTIGFIVTCLTTVALAWIIKEASNGKDKQ